MHPDPRVMEAVLRTDLLAFSQQAFRTLEPGTPFQSNWHLEHVAHLLQQVANGVIRRLIINVPPRSGKSLMASVAFPAWVLGRDPSRRLICVSYAEDLARKLSVDTRSVMQSPWFERLFPDCRLYRRPRDVELVTSQRGARYAAGVGGAVLGRGADIIVVDDPIKALNALSRAERRRVNEFYDNTLQTRLNSKLTGAIVIIMQRLHQEDLVGHVLERDPEGWTVVSVPAIEHEDRAYALSSVPGDLYRRRVGEVLHPEREPLDLLDDLRRDIGTMNFSAQYQQAPVPPGGNVIKRAWLRDYGALPHRFEKVVISWDTASTLGEHNDWSVGTVWGRLGPDFYLLDVVRGRWETPELQRRIEELAVTYRAHATVIEDTELGRAINHGLRKAGTLRTILIKPRFDKEARLLAEAPKFEAGRVVLPREAPWLGVYLKELLGFPKEKHDDQVDATSQALLYLTEHRRQPYEAGGAIYGPSGRRSLRTEHRLREEARREADREDAAEIEVFEPQEPRITTVPAEYELPEAMLPRDRASGSR